MNLVPLFVVVVVFALHVECTVIQLIRNNIIGPAVNFETFQWPTDPDAGIRRREEYEAINGRHGYKHVERLGLGEDGRSKERKLQQILRDQTGDVGQGYGRYP